MLNQRNIFLRDKKFLCLVKPNAAGTFYSKYSVP